jgi:hypothetical protein
MLRIGAKGPALHKALCRCALDKDTRAAWLEGAEWALSTAEDFNPGNRSLDISQG